MEIAFFGSSLVSAYWNGAATYYRGLLHALFERGHKITFFEPDAYERQSHRDIEDPPWAKVIVYPSDPGAALASVELSRSADLVIKASGVGVFDELLEEAVVDQRRAGGLLAFWDVDAPATLDRLENDVQDAFRALVPRYDLVLTYGGGAPVVERYLALGARSCTPIYNALDPRTHFRVAEDPRFRGDLGFLGNRLPDREARVESFFFEAARRLPDRRFLLGGSGWDETPRVPNVKSLGHVYTRDHNAFNSSVGIALNINRESMARAGYSPATRIFEAAGAAACIVTDDWVGIEEFLEPGREVLVARDADDVARHVVDTSPEIRRRIGEAARRRVVSEHTYARRALELEQLLSARELEEAS